MLKHTRALSAHPLMALSFAFALALSLYAGGVSAQMIDYGTSTPQDTQDMGGSSGDGADATLQATSTGLPVTGVGGISNSTLSVLLASLFAFGVGAIMMRKEETA